MKISSCILTRNNELTLGRAIQSVISHVDEVVVVDTGSNDNSVLIAKELGATVHFFPWCKDFSAARNTSLQHATGADWVLIIDSDEEFVWNESFSLRDWLTEYDPAQDVIAFECRNIENINLKTLAVTHSERLFSPLFFCYEGIIHERLIRVNSQRESKLVTVCPCAMFNHFGYSSEFHEQKNLRNTDLLIKAIQTNPLDALNYRYMVAEKFNSRLYAESLSYSKKALQLIPLKEKYSRAQVYYYQMMSHLFLDNVTGAETVIEACINELPFYADAYGIAGEICFKTKRWEESYCWFMQWEQKVMDHHNHMQPYHCISLKETFQEHKRIAAIEVIRNEAGTMKIGILIAYADLELDWENLIEHIQMRFNPFTYEIFAWDSSYGSKPSKSSKSSKRLSNQNRVCELHGKDLEEAKSNLLASCDANLIWLWEANERLQVDMNADMLIDAIAHSGKVTVRAYSDRLGAEWREERICINDRYPLKAITSSMIEAANDDANHERSLKQIIIEKPLILPIEKHMKYMEAYSNESPLKKLLASFSCHEYKTVIDMENPDPLTSEWVTTQFFKTLAYINQNSIEEASSIVYQVLDSDLEEEFMLDFIYLYAKLSQNVTISDMKKDAIELLDSILESNMTINTRHILTSETHWLALKAELLWQLDDHQQAILTWRHSLESSSFTNEECAYRIAWAIYEEYKAEGADQIARKILEIFQVDSSEARLLISPIFTYLNMTEWALLFQTTRQLRNIDEIEVEDQALVSIILPVYNDVKFLSESIRSVLNQTYVNLELIIVDDGSDVDIKKMVDKFKYDKRIRFYKLKDNQGLPKALNFGISEAKGSIVGWTSADNYVHPRWLERMIFTLQDYPKASGIISDYYHIDKDGIVLETKRMPAYKLNGLQNGGPSFLWRAASLNKTGPFDETLFGIEDRDFTVRMALSGKILLLPEPLYYYRIHDQSLSSKIDSGSLGGWSSLHDKLKKKWLYLSFI
ncbi:glycosyltransferase [Paenibacillus sp.]|uniref:glycosyltransferase family 2 protein n=1 Tax=Paenibacillus sp. TaxID=58172 RepID=UPI00283AA1E8|nr:glycosyltransferase [Paenibacillus sp.]